MQTYLGDCLNATKIIPDASVDLVYLDPPFFTQKTQKLTTRDGRKQFSFDDKWKSGNEYAEFLWLRLNEFRRVLSNTGSIFFHCDNNASHIARLLLDDVFKPEMFRAEIIWHYRRWSNSQKTLLPSHQNIYFYSKTIDYKFNSIYQEYSPSTNVDQILHKRKRDENGKSVYAKDENGSPVFDGNKKGVLMGDVWDIPFLNPKAKERVGYPTQKPITLLERIIKISTDEGDTVLDPFCGSGTTLLAAKLLGRDGIGIDVSAEAIELTEERLKNPFKTESRLCEVGREEYRSADKTALRILEGLDLIPVQRNNGIDAFLNVGLKDSLVLVRIQKPQESLFEAAFALHNAAKGKNAEIMILVATQSESELNINIMFPQVFIVESTSNAINKLLLNIKDKIYENCNSGRNGTSRDDSGAGV